MQCSYYMYCYPFRNMKKNDDYCRALLVYINAYFYFVILGKNRDLAASADE